MQSRFQLLTTSIVCRFRNDLVHRPRDDDRLQRRHGLHVRLLLRKNSADQAQPEEDLGRLYRWRIRNSRLRRRVLVFPVQIPVLRMPNRVFGNCRKDRSRLRAELFVQTTGIWNSHCKQSGKFQFRYFNLIVQFTGKN